jgi:diguanylate cyclase (GGDEF)-like protein
MRIGLRTRVVLLALISALPLALADIYRAEEARRRALEAARNDGLALARSIAAANGETISQTRLLLTGFAARTQLHRSELFGPRCADNLRNLLDANPAHRNIALADGKGLLHCAAKPLDRPINVSDRRYFRRALAEQAFTLSEPLDARDGGGLLMVAAQPVLNGDKTVSGVLIASFEAERLSRAFEAARLPEDLVASLTDAHGKAIARWPFAPDVLGTTIQGFAETLAANREEGSIDIVDRDGIERVSVYTRVPNAPGPLYVVSGIPRSQIEQGPRDRLVRDLLWLGGILALALALGFIGAHSLVVQPIRRLTVAAKRYATGDLSARSSVSHSADEIGKLAAAFDTLAADNQRVTRAFRALSGGNQTLLRARDEAGLLEAMCRNAVERAGYRLAFVNYAEHDERRSVRTVAKVGHDEGFVAALDLTWADTERGRGSVGTAIREARTVVIRSMPTDPRFAPWRESAIARGFGSVASFPLCLEGEVIGAFTLVAVEEDAFDSAELQLLEEMAADLAFGIQSLRSHARRVAAEEAALRATTHDAVTGLPGRNLLIRNLQAALLDARGRNQPLAVLVVCLPSLQDLHDGLGYASADAALSQAASRLKSGATPASYLARLSADEFCLVLPQADPPSLQKLQAHVQALLERPVDVKGASIRMRAALGASLYPAHGDEAEMLLRRATIAAREASRRELGFFLYSGATERENPDRLALAADLGTAIDERALALHFQPKVVLASGAPCGAEALARWLHPKRGMVPPMQFISIAEQTGLIRPLTNMVIELALRQLVAWRDARTQIPIAINLSPRNLHDPQLLDTVGDGLARAGVAPSLLEIEITETALAEDPDHARGVLEKLRALGCKLYVDDFGTGYSSLSYLVSLPLDAVKIDRSFVRQMSRSREARTVVASIILMARELRLRTVAEGVETEQDAELLREMGCEEAQGYFFGRPVAAEQFSSGKAG